MSRIVVVPDEIRDALYAKIDEQIALHPGALPDREYFYSELLTYFDDHGVIPDFKLEKL